MDELEAVNVNFGDCFICRTAGDQMLIDFGSTRKLSDSVCNFVNTKLNYHNNYLMITHFHRDHYSGIKHLDSKIQFSEVYLPNFFSKSIIRLEFALLALLRASTESYLIAYNLISVIPDLYLHLQYNSRICFVKRGDYIQNTVDKFRVLWPDCTNIDDKADKLYKQLMDYYKVTEKSDKENIILSMTDEYMNLLEPLFSAEQKEILIDRDNLSNLSELRRIIHDFAENNDNFKDFKPKKRLSSKLGRSISSFQNNISLCCDNYTDDKSSQDKKLILFLSDVNTSSYEKIAATKEKKFELADLYYAIKVPHHGTKDYFINNLPQSSYLIISNGKAMMSWRITALYGVNYCDRCFICTNYLGACDYELTGKRCTAYLNLSQKSQCGINISYLLKT